MLGEKVSDVRAHLGDPLRFVRVAEGTIVSRYPVANGSLFVDEHEGAVTGVRLVSGLTPVTHGETLKDHYGVSLGTSHDDALAKHGGTPVHNTVYSLEWRDEAAVTLYQFTRDARVATIDIIGSLEPASATANVLVPPGEHDGSSTAQAIVILADDDYSARWERFYFVYNPCESAQQWVSKQHALLQVNAHQYDRESVVCPTTKATRDFFFDVTAPMEATSKKLAPPKPSPPKASPGE